MLPAADASGLCAAPLRADGIYEGMLTDEVTRQQVPVIAIIAENGDGRMSGEDGTYYYRLNVAESSNGLSGSFHGYSEAGHFPNGNQLTSGSLTATANSSGLSGTLTDTSGDTETLSLTFDGAYDLTSSLPMLAGDWSYAANGFTLTATISTDGTLSAVDSNGCSYSGAFGLIDPSFNAYNASYTLSCGGTDVTYTGVASYFPASGSAVAQIRMLSDDGAGHYLVADLQ